MALEKVILFTEIYTICTRMFILALFVIETNNIGNPPMCINLELVR